MDILMDDRKGVLLDDVNECIDWEIKRQVPAECIPLLEFGYESFFLLSRFIEFTRLENTPVLVPTSENYIFENLIDGLRINQLGLQNSLFHF